VVAINLAALGPGGELRRGTLHCPFLPHDRREQLLVLSIVAASVQIALHEKFDVLTEDCHSEGPCGPLFRERNMQGGNLGSLYLLSPQWFDGVRERRRVSSPLPPPRRGAAGGIRDVRRSMSVIV